MLKQNSLLVYLFGIVCFANAETPPYLTKCKAEDSKCILESTKAVLPIFVRGIPEIKVPSIDPIKFKTINASEGNLLFVLNDVTAVGLSNCEVKEISRNKAKMKMQVMCSGTLDGHYILKGSLLFVPIEGNGAIHADLRSCVVNIDMDIVEKDGADGKKHWAIKTWSHNFDLKDKSTVVFDNLFDGNEVLGSAARELVANNGNDIIKEIGPNVIKTIVARLLKYINLYFAAFGIEELSLNN